MHCPRQDRMSQKCGMAWQWWIAQTATNYRPASQPGIGHQGISTIYDLIGCKNLLCCYFCKYALAGGMIYDIAGTQTTNVGVFALVELLSKLDIQVFSKVLIVPLHYSSKYHPTTGTVALYIIHRNMHKAAVSWLMNIQNTIMSVAVVPFPFRLSLLCAP